MGITIKSGNDISDVGSVSRGGFFGEKVSTRSLPKSNGDKRLALARRC